MTNYRTFFVSVPVAVSALAGFSAASASPRVMQSPFACDRLALTPALRHRHFDILGPLLRTKVLAVRADPDGYAFRFPNDLEAYVITRGKLVSGLGRKQNPPMSD
jgi:hypothetical protein